MGGGGDSIRGKSSSQPLQMYLSGACVRIPQNTQRKGMTASSNARNSIAP